jgi:hypothetical protein
MIKKLLTAGALLVVVFAGVYYQEVAAAETRKQRLEREAREASQKNQNPVEVVSTQVSQVAPQLSDVPVDTPINIEDIKADLDIADTGSVVSDANIPAAGEPASAVTGKKEWFYKRWLNKGPANPARVFFSSTVPYDTAFGLAKGPWLIGRRGTTYEQFFNNLKRYMIQFDDNSNTKLQINNDFKLNRAAILGQDLTEDDRWEVTCYEALDTLLRLLIVVNNAISSNSNIGEEVVQKNIDAIKGLVNNPTMRLCIGRQFGNEGSNAMLDELVRIAGK